MDLLEQIQESFDDHDEDYALDLIDQAIDELTASGSLWLEQAIVTHMPHVIDHLLTHGVDPNARSAERTNDPSPLGVAARVGGGSAMLQALMDAGAQVNHPLDHKFGSALHHALRFQGDGVDTDMVNLLLSAGADVNVEWQGVGSPLHLAVNVARPSVIQALLGAGAPLDVLCRGQRPMTIAHNLGRQDVVVMLRNHEVRLLTEAMPQSTLEALDVNRPRL